jgi:hypothetical protein
MSAVAGEMLQPKHSAKLFGAAQSVVDSMSGYRMNLFDRAEFDRHIQIARGELGNEIFERVSNEGRGLTTEQAIALATKMKID